MFTLIATIHVIVAVMLVLLVLVQDSKGGAGMFAGGSSQSILGATGGATLLSKMTRFAAIIFALCSILLTIYTSRKGSSVTEGAPLPPVPVQALPTTPTEPGNMNGKAAVEEKPTSKTPSTKAAEKSKTPEKK